MTIIPVICWPWRSTFTTFDPASVSQTIYTGNPPPYPVATLSADKLTFNGANLPWDEGAHSVVGHTSGKYYCEFTCSALFHPSTTAGWAIGAGTATAVHNDQPKTDPNYLGSNNNEGIGWWGDTHIYLNGVTILTDASIAVAVGDVVGMALDLDNLKIWFRKNGGIWNVNALANPATNVGGIDISGTGMNGGTSYAWTDMEEINSVTANFGATPYASTPPSGFSNW